MKAAQHRSVTKRRTVKESEAHALAACRRIEARGEIITPSALAAEAKCTRQYAHVLIARLHVNGALSREPATVEVWRVAS